MDKLNCRICHKLERIISFNRDNPVLSCGHIQEAITFQDQAIVALRKIEREAAELMKLRGISESEAYAAIVTYKREENKRNPPSQYTLSLISPKVKARIKQLSSRFKFDRPKGKGPIPIHSWDVIEELAAKFGKVQHKDSDGGQ
jgi:hypothetical protein